MNKDTNYSFAKQICSERIIVLLYIIISILEFLYFTRNAQRDTPNNWFIRRRRKKMITMRESSSGFQQFLVLVLDSPEACSRILEGPHSLCPSG